MSEVGRMGITVPTMGYGVARGGCVMSKEANASPLERGVLRYVNQMSTLASMGHCVPTDAMHIAELVDRIMERDAELKELQQTNLQSLIW